MIDQHKSLSEKFLRKGFWLYLFSFIIAPIWYIIKIIISWELTVSEVWVLYGVISLITMIAAYNDLWLTDSLNYFIPKFITEERYDKVKSILAYTFITQVSTWILIACFFFFWSDFIANNYFKTETASWVLKVFAFFFLWINIFQIISTFFLVIQNTLYNKLIEFFRMIFILISILCVFYMENSTIIEYTYSWIVWLYIWIIIAICLFYKKYYNKYFKQNEIIWDKKLIKKVFKYALVIFIWWQASVILSQIDMQMIIYILWTQYAWYYTNYLSIITIPFVIIWPIFWLLYPVFSEMNSKWATKKIKLIKSVFQKIFITIAIYVNLIFFVFAENIAFILFWEKFIESWVILKYSIFLLVFNFLLQINMNILAWIWKVKARLKIVTIAVIFNFFTNLIFIKLIWVYWAALATWIWWCLIWVLWEYYLWKKYFVKIDIFNILRNIAYLWIIWLFLYLYISPSLEWLSRLNNFYILLITTMVTFLLFILINLNQFKIFLNEIKKLKN